MIRGRRSPLATLLLAWLVLVFIAITVGSVAGFVLVGFRAVLRLFGQ